MITVEQLWAEKYSGLLASAEAEESQRRAEDFIDVPRTVCGLELRAITPRDLLLLDYAGSPFIRGGEIKDHHIPQFLWQLCDPQPRHWWQEKLFYWHVGDLTYEQAVREIRAYLDRTFADAPAVPASEAKEPAPIGTSFVAPLIVRIAAGIPALTPPMIMDTPLPQLFQYQKILAAEAAAKSGGKFREDTPAARLLRECLEEANRLNQAQRDPEPVEGQPVHVSHG